MCNKEDKNCAFIAIMVTIAKIKHCALVLNGRAIFFFCCKFYKLYAGTVAGWWMVLFVWICYVCIFVGRHFWDFLCSMLIQPDLLWKLVKKNIQFFIFSLCNVCICLLSTHCFSKIHDILSQKLSYSLVSKIVEIAYFILCNISGY